MAIRGIYDEECKWNLYPHVLANHRERGALWFLVARLRPPRYEQRLRSAVLISGLYPVDYGGLPNINITSYTPIGDYGGAQVPPETTPQYIDNLSIIHGKHTIKTGLDIAVYRVSSPPTVAGFGIGVGKQCRIGPL